VRAKKHPLEYFADKTEPMDCEKLISQFIGSAVFYVPGKNFNLCPIINRCISISALLPSPP
jgi:hypothetical protein